MAKIDHFRHRNLNPADELRSTLNTLEDSQPKLNSLSATQTLELLRHLDQLQTLFDQLDKTGVNLTSERGRFDALQSGLKNKSSILLRRLGGPAALSEYRPKPGA